MKTTIILIILIAGLIMVAGYFTMANAKTETQKYKTLYKDGNFEIRFYPEAVFASVDLNGNYDNMRNSGFRVLAGYIFGGNQEKAQIAMTSPVRMGTDAQSNTMSFVVPSEYELEELPTPNDSRVKLHNSEPVYTASIRFGGYADSSKLKEKEKQLLEMLSEMKIVHLEQTQYLGYNPPYQMVNRRNEVLVELKDFNPEVLQEITNIHKY